MIFLDLTARLISLFLTVSSYGMALRMMLPLFVNPDDSRLYMFTCIISEPIVAPVRTVLYAFGIDDTLPIDIALPTAYILLFVIQLFLPAL